MSKKATYRKHFVEETTKNGLFKYPIKKWALNQKEAFPNKGFTNATTDYPATHEIVAVMIKNYGYTRSEINGEVILKNEKSDLVS